MYQKDIMQGQIGYNHELTTLINLVKSETPEGFRVIEILKTGDEGKIRHMLKNFGNPEYPEWGDITSASPWADWQIDQAVKDLNVIKPAELADPYFWAW
jgi:hypothetical protein